MVCVLPVDPVHQLQIKLALRYVLVIDSAAINAEQFTLLSNTELAVSFINKIYSFSIPNFFNVFFRKSISITC